MDRDAIRAATERLRNLLSQAGKDSKLYRPPITHSKDPDTVRESYPVVDGLSPIPQRVLVCYGRVRGLDTLLESQEFRHFDSVVYVLSDQKYFIFNSDKDKEYIEADPDRLEKRIATRHGRLADLVLREAGSSGVPILISSGDVGLMEDGRGVFDYGPIVSTNELRSEGPKVVAVYGDRAGWGDDYDVMVSKTNGNVVISDRITGEAAVLDVLEVEDYLPRGISIGVTEGIVTDVKDFSLKYPPLRSREYVGRLWSNWINVNRKIEKGLSKGPYRASGPLDSFFDGFVGFCGMDPERLSGREAEVFWNFITGSFRKQYSDQRELEEAFREFSRLQVFELGGSKPKKS